MAKTPANIRSLARAHTESALNVLASIINERKAPASARVAAAHELLDRGWGKATQIIAGDEDAPLIIQQIERIIVQSSHTNGRDISASSEPSEI